MTVFIDSSAIISLWDQDGFQKRTSKNLSFFDYTSLAIIREFNMDKVFTFDRDFKKLGVDMI